MHASAAALAGSNGVDLVLFSIGLPGRFAEWCDAVTARFAGRPTEECLIQRWPAPDDMVSYRPVAPILDELGRLLIQTSVGALVIGARQPDLALRRVLADTKARFIIALEHPRVAAADLFEFTGAEPGAVVRAVANSCASLVTYPALPGALLLYGESGRADPVGNVLSIAKHFDIALEPAGATRIVEELAAAGLPLVPEHGRWTDRFPADGLKALAGAVGGYEECFAGRGQGQLVWNRDLFFADARFRATDAVALAGGPRAVVYGPYIHLPAGFWTAQVYIGVSPDAAGQMLLIEAYAGAPLATTSLQPPSDGIFMAEIDFVLPEPSGPGVEIRVCAPQDGLRGQIAFGRVVLRPADRAGQPNSIGGWEEMESVLGL